MNIGKINLITPPDRLFNSNLSYLLVKPSTHVKQQFQAILSQNFDEVNVFIFDENETDISWLLSTAVQSDIIIIDIDNCDIITRQFVTFMLSLPNTHYITSDEITPYGLISKNRIYDLDWIAEQLTANDEEEDDEENNEG
jgi:hypothetical protein